MCIRDPINKTCRKNGKDLSNGAPNIKLWNHTKKTHFPVFAKNFRRPCMKLKNFFCQFPNPWTLRVSGMGGYASKCEKKSKSLHPTVHSDFWFRNSFSLYTYMLEYKHAVRPEYPPCMGTTMNSKSFHIMPLFMQLSIPLWYNS